MKLRAFGLFLMASSGLTPMAYAQEAQRQGEAERATSQGLDDIVVTATRTGETRAQATPLAMTVLSGDKLSAAAVTNVKDLVSLTPNLSVAQVTASAAIYIRGIGSNNVFAGSDPDVTVQSDGVYIARAFGQFADFVDIDRIEVLRGPQGTLYGRNAVGGTINIISKLPGDDFRAKVQLATGSYGLLQQQSYVSGPLIPGRVQASLSSNYIRHGDYMKNVVSGQDGTQNANRGGVRGQLRVALSDSVTAITRADFSKGREHVDTYDHPLAPVAYAPVASSLIGNYRRIALDAPERSDTKIWGISEQIDVDLGGGFALKSLTAYRRSRYDLVVDQDGTEAAAGTSRQSETSKQFSQELNLTVNLDRIDGVLGLFYFRDDQRSYNISNNPPSPRTAAVASSLSIFQPKSYARSFAIFAQASYKLTDPLSLTLGARYTRDRKRVDQQVDRTSLNPPTLGTNFPGFPFIARDARTDSAFTPKIGLDYQITPAILAYVSATKGFKSGGTNFAATNPAALSFGPERIWSYEAGLKSDLLDRRLRFNVSAFRYDYTDLQVQALLGVGVVAIANAASARVQGIEFETTARPVSDLTLTGNFSLLDTKYRNFPSASIPGALIPFVSADPRYNPATRTFDASGNRLNAAPRFSLQGSAQYEFDLGAGRGFARADYYRQGKAYYDPSNASIMAQKAYGLLNGALGYNDRDAGWSVQLIGKNLTKTEYLITIAANGVTPSGLAGAPRTLTLQLTKSW